MSSRGSIFDILRAAAGSIQYADEIAGAMANDLTTGFDTNDLFDEATFTEYARHSYTLWVTAPKSEMHYAIELDPATLNDNSAEGMLVGTMVFNIPRGNRPQVRLSKNSQGRIHVKLVN